MRNKYILVSVLTVLLLLVGLDFRVSAQSVITTPTGSSAVKKPIDPAKDTNLAQRTSQRQVNNSSDISHYVTAKISANCLKAQAKLKTLNEKESSFLTDRQDQYIKAANKLGDTIDKVKKLGVDTSETAAAQKAFAGTVSQYLSDVESYQLAVSDTLAVDCAGDPTGFLANLQEARTLRKQLISDNNAVKTSWADVKTALENIKNRLSKT